MHHLEYNQKEENLNSQGDIDLIEDFVFGKKTIFPLDKMRKGNEKYAENSYNNKGDFYSKENENEKEEFFDLADLGVLEADDDIFENFDEENIPVIKNIYKRKKCSAEKFRTKQNFSRNGNITNNNNKNNNVNCNSDLDNLNSSPLGNCGNVDKKNTFKEFEGDMRKDLRFIGKSIFFLIFFNFF